MCCWFVSFFNGLFRITCVLYPIPNIEPYEIRFIFSQIHFFPFFFFFSGLLFNGQIKLY